ncbi:hypothetical protein N7454_008308 [Penicillium verhagenii]|nr:hypothetical protein N7454_008308 [Penicillium verhagenii]
MQIKQIIPTLSILLTTFPRTHALENAALKAPNNELPLDTLSRYKEPLPSNISIINTKLGFSESQDAHPGTHPVPQNGGYYLKYQDSEKIVAASTDNLSAALDLAYLSLYWNLEETGEHEEAVELARELADNGFEVRDWRPEELENGSNACSHPHCVYAGVGGKCVLYTGCFWCGRNRKCF